MTKTEISILIDALEAFEHSYRGAHAQHDKDNWSVVEALTRKLKSALVNAPG